MSKKPDTDFEQAIGLCDLIQDLAEDLANPEERMQPTPAGPRPTREELAEEIAGLAQNTKKLIQKIRADAAGSRRAVVAGAIRPLKQ